MPLETDVDYLGDLDPASPGPAEFKSEGDDHIRNTKKALRQSFPGATGPILLMGAATGTDAYVLTPARPLVDYVANMLVAVKIPAANTTTAPTLNVSSLGPKAIKAVNGAALAIGDLLANSYQLMLYNGTDLLLLAPTQGFIDRMNTALHSYTDAEVAELKAYIDQLVFVDALPNQAGNRGKCIGTNGTDANWYNVIPTISVYETSTTWVADVPRIRLTVLGASGSTAAVYANPYTGGAAGGAAIKVLDVVIGVTYTITVGAGGAAVSVTGGSTTPVDGNAGGTSSFSGPGIPTVSATGGGGGRSQTYSNPGGVGTGGDINLRGGVSHLASYNDGSSWGGDSLLGKGAPVGQDADSYGAGPGGGTGSNNMTGRAGFKGVVIIERVPIGV